MRDSLRVTPETGAAARIRRCFERLEGGWRLDRRILDRPQGGTHALARAAAGAGTPAMRAHLRGEAWFRRRDDGALAYMEEGTLALTNGVRMHAVRRYVYRLEGAALLVEFADGPDTGRRYLRLDAVDDEAGNAPGGAEPADWRGSDEHLCGRDRYRAAYRFRGFAEGEAAPRIVQRTLVDGPRKAYAIVTLLRPLSRD